MTALTKLACAFVLAGGLAAPAFAATTGTPSPGSAAEPNAANSQNAMSNDQNGPAAGQNAMHMASACGPENLSKAGYTDITSHSAVVLHGPHQGFAGQSGDDGGEPKFGDRDHGRNAHADSASNANRTGRR